MFYPQDYKVTPIVVQVTRQDIEDQVRTPTPKEVLIWITNLDLDPAANGMCGIETQFFPCQGD